MSKEFKVKFVTRSVNSKRLLKEIKTMAEEVCNEYISYSNSILDKNYEYDELAHFLDMYFEDLVVKNRITQYDIVADHRNNTLSDTQAGIINITIKFRQTNCINVSKIDMQFTAE